MKLKTPELNTELHLTCPRKSCLHFGLLDNKIIKDGCYCTKHDAQPRQMLRCTQGKHRFSETGYSDLFGKQGSFKEYEQAAKLSSYGLSTAAIADVLGKDERTIHTWLQAIGKKANRFHSFICLAIPLSLLFIQMDELWSYLFKKQKQLWVFIGLDVNTRFWINFELGSRTTHTATKLVERIKSYLGVFSADKPLKITTDKLSAYKNALESVLGEMAYVYLQIVKKRINKRLVTVKKCFVKGQSTDFTGKSQNTSFIERFNLTLRQRVCYLHRKSLGFCKKKANFNTVLWINLFDYNYRRLHKSLRLPTEQPSTRRFEQKWLHQTPAMAMGLTSQQLTWRFLFVAPVRLNC